jgi:hypothetical protein
MTIVPVASAFTTFRIFNNNGFSMNSLSSFSDFFQNWPEEAKVPMDTHVVTHIAAVSAVARAHYF